MEANQLMELAASYHENREFITNEETAKMALIVPFIKMLGYDPNVPREVRLEYAAEFTQGDGKKFADRMDFAIFDKCGCKPLIAIEAKPLGSDLAAKSMQLARYIAQMEGLHFGIMTDGCRYMFFGDLENPNVMDSKPFFSFSLDDNKTDWVNVANFLSKFSRDSFNAETLVTDAENSHYLQAMIKKLSTTLRAPDKNESFMKWLTEDVYKGLRTSLVMKRMGKVAVNAIEPALMQVIGDDFLDGLKERILQHRNSENGEVTDESNESEISADEENTDKPIENAEIKTKNNIVTTQEELDCYETVKNICQKSDIMEDDILYKDTTAYFNISFNKPTKWFLRYFGDAKRKNISTLVPIEEAKELVNGFEVEEAPAAYGATRVYIDSVSQLWALKSIILRSLEILREGKKIEDGNNEQNDTREEVSNY